MLDLIVFLDLTKNPQTFSKKIFLERNPKVAWDAGVNVLPVQVALAYDIKLIFYAEHGESEYGGKILSENSAKFRDLSEVLENQIGDDPNNWIDDVVTEKDLNSYTYPDTNEINKKYKGILFWIF